VAAATTGTACTETAGSGCWPATATAYATLADDDLPLAREPVDEPPPDDLPPDDPPPDDPLPDDPLPDAPVPDEPLPDKPLPDEPLPDEVPLEDPEPPPDEPLALAPGAGDAPDFESPAVFVPASAPFSCWAAAAGSFAAASFTAARLSVR